MHLNLWVAPRMGDIDYEFLTILQTLKYTLTGMLPDALTYDEVSRATPLDVMKSGLNNMRTTVEIRAMPVMGDFRRRRLGVDRQFHRDRRFLADDPQGHSLAHSGRCRHRPAGPAGIMWLLNQGTAPSPGFHMFGGAAILCAFFIATDPVSAATSPRGRLLYGIGIGFLIYAIRTWGILCRWRRLCRSDHEHGGARDRLHYPAAYRWP